MDYSAPARLFPKFTNLLSTGTALFQLAASKKSIYFYNTSGVVITVNRDAFNPKYFKK